ncbi:hypothetical protein EYF80_061353 [Liparis tanakae]|uniref:Uncharacterized protein n=1 Tax=Liparis tanakae TaxID=230148 RepID=A0A4Z2EIC7_9TELE|nr:hypothetical protein EYF80_061353 [Liparis tanakae]
MKIKRYDGPVLPELAFRINRPTLGPSTSPQQLTSASVKRSETAISPQTGFYKSCPSISPPPPSPPPTPKIPPSPPPIPDHSPKPH